MIEPATGIILRTRPLTETSLIIHWITPHWGRLATVAKGARRPKSPFAGKLDLFYRAEFSFSRSRLSDLHTLREVNLLETHLAIRSDLAKLQQAAYATAFIEQTTETETPLAEVYQLLANFLEWLCAHPPQLQNVLTLELKLLRILGMEPDLSETRLTPGAKKIASALLETGWAESARLKLSRAQFEELRQWLHGFLIFHLGGLPRGRGAALAAET
jgi:DNA repair protein RecO (recombination protein O)